MIRAEQATIAFKIVALKIISELILATIQVYYCQIVAHKEYVFVCLALK